MRIEPVPRNDMRKVFISIGINAFGNNKGQPTDYITLCRRCAHAICQIDEFDWSQGIFNIVNRNAFCFFRRWRLTGDIEFNGLIKFAN